MEKETMLLSETQSWMQSTLVKPRLTNIELINQYIAPAKRLSAEESLAIYQRSYYSRLVECMRGQFKALVYTLGNELFDDFSRMYLRKHPSSSASLSDLGVRFPSFLEENRPDKENQEIWIDFMIAMAQYEVDLYRIFDIKGSEGASFANFNTNDNALKLQDCFDLKKYPFDVNTYYQKVADEMEPQITKANKTYVAFVRTNYQVYVIPISEIQFYFLEVLKKEENINKALKKVSVTYNLKLELVLDRWALWKEEWIRKGFFLEVLP